MRHEDYVKKLREVAKETSHISSMKSIPTGKVLLETLEKFFYLQHEVNHLFVNNPTFSRYSEVGEIYRRMMKIKIRHEET